jgi:hypothetical protein
MYLDKRVLAYSLASAGIGFCVLLCLLVHDAGWLIVEDIVDDKDVSGGYFAVLGAISKYWEGLLKFFVILTLTILFHTVIFDRLSLSRGKWRFAIPHFPGMMARNGQEAAHV